jgi:hypothetical protein
MRLNLVQMRLNLVQMRLNLVQRRLLLSSFIIFQIAQPKIMSMLERVI